MVRMLRVGLASIEDASSVRAWSGTPFNILNALRNKRGVEVVLISPMGQRLKWAYGLRMLLAKLCGENFDWKREPRALRNFARTIERRFEAEKLDVIFSPSSIPGTLVRADFPVVFWTDASQYAMNGYYRKNQSARTARASALQEETAVRKARFACYASEWGSTGVQEIAGRDSVKVIPFGPNLTVEHSKDDVEQWIKERAHRAMKCCTLLLVGVEWTRKGCETAVDAARRLNQAGIETRLRIVGCNPPPEREPLPPFVELLGFINKHEPEGYKKLSDVYRTSDILILPSREEAYGVVIPEAAAFGLPALVCRTGGLAETVRDGVTGFQLPVEDDGRQFAEHAQMILKDYERFAGNAYAEYATRMNWPTSVERLVELLREAAGKEFAENEVEMNEEVSR